MDLCMFLAKMAAFLISSMLVTTNVPADKTEIVPTDIIITEPNYMQIACEHCHENFAADVNQNIAVCPHCGHVHHFEG